MLITTLSDSITIYPIKLVASFNFYKLHLNFIGVIVTIVFFYFYFPEHKSTIVFNNFLSGICRKIFLISAY